MGALVMMDPFRHYRRPGPRASGEPVGYLGLPGMADLLGGPLF